MQYLGLTRSTRKATHLLHTPDAFVRAALPGMVEAVAVVHASPALGAGFLQYTAELAAGGSMAGSVDQRFVYVMDGAVSLTVDGVEHRMGAGGYGYLPGGQDAAAGRIVAAQASRLSVIEKQYVALDGVAAPAGFVAREEEIAGVALNGDEGLMVRSLLPQEAGFDFAVNTMTYAPGAALAQVEVHVMEHGLVMLEGGGIYRLGEDWYGVEAGDFIWMAPYCPQWFGALGKVPARYLIYKDWNRRPTV